MSNQLAPLLLSARSPALPHCARSGCGDTCIGIVNVWKVVGSVSLLLQGCPSLGSALAPTPRCSLTLSPSPRCSHSSHSGRPPPPSSSSSPPERAAPACSSCVSWRGGILGR